MRGAANPVTDAFMRNRHALMAFIRAFVRDPDAAEDIFQDVWLALAQSCDRGIEIADVPRWCRGTAKNIMLNRWRDARTTKVVADSRLLEAVDVGFTEYDASAERWATRRRALIKCIDELTQERKEILRLKYTESLTAAEVGARLRRSAEAVLMTLSRLRQALARCAQERLAAEGADQ